MEYGGQGETAKGMEKRRGGGNSILTAACGEIKRAGEKNLSVSLTDAWTASDLWIL